MALPAATRIPTHREVIMSPSIALPPYKLSDAPPARSISIGEWIVTATTTTISDAAALSALQRALPTLPALPEMTFGANTLTLRHAPSGWTYAFTARGALSRVHTGPPQDGDGHVEVGYADAWRRSRTADGPAVAARPYDWTFTTTYGGHIKHQRANSEESTESTPDDEEEGEKSDVHWEPAQLGGLYAIPLAELTRPDPILFYAEVPVFEDELHDNGSSHFTVRVRVMPTCIFVLCRAALRVDDVLFRLHDTRIYISLAAHPPVVVRETSGLEAPYARIVQLLPNKHDRTPLTDDNFIAKVLTTLPAELTRSVDAGAGTNWRALGTKLEVLQLHETAGNDGARRGGEESAAILADSVARLDIDDKPEA